MAEASHLAMERGSEPAAGGPQDIFHARSNIVPLPLITRARGVHMWDEEGRRYIDVSSGPVVSNIGHCDPRVARAMHDQALELDFAYSRVSRHRPNIALAERLAALCGPGFERVCLASGGSEAVEIAIKFLRQYAYATGQAGRHRVITCNPSYHGGTVYTLGMSGDDEIAPVFGDMVTLSSKVPAPMLYRLPPGHTAESHAEECAEALERQIQALGPETVLAFVFEPVGGLATGCLVAPEVYYRRIREICDRYGVYLVFDEVMCGAGRTGRFLAAHHWPAAAPDIVVLAKGLGAGYAPLAAMVAPAAMVDRLAALTGFNYSHTYNANPISCAVGNAILDIMEADGLMANAAAMGARLRSGLEALAADCPLIGDVRGLGLLMAVEMVGDQGRRTPLPAAARAPDRVRIIGLRHGLIIYSRRTSGGRYGDWFMVAPPLCVTEAEVEDMLARLGATLREFAEELRAENLLS